MYHHCPVSAPRCPLPWAQVAGVHSQALPDLPNGTFDLEQLELAIREAHGSQYHPRPELICLENTHSSAGGRALPLPCLRQVRAHGRCWHSPARLGPAQWHCGDTGAQRWLVVVARDAPGVPPKPAVPRLPGPWACRP